MSNNLAENSIRPFVVGRKNWEFCTAVKGAEASVAAYSIVETAKANGLGCRKYLTYLTEPVIRHHLAKRDNDYLMLILLRDINNSVVWSTL